MKEIKLSSGFFTYVDDEDYDKLMSMGKWCLATVGYAVKRWQGRLIYMHKVILPAPENSNLITDHIDRDKLNNQRSNLRLVTHSDSLRNRGRCHRGGFKDNIPYKGVVACNGRFRAIITIDGKQKHLGMFNTAKEAAQAYDVTAQQIYGDTISRNFYV